MTTLLNNDAAASALGITASTLRFWRWKGCGPKFIKLGQSKQAGVVYDTADIEAWKAARTFTSTSAVTVSHPGNA